jgi:sugar porter (SP) family MFS transporter
MNDRKSNSYTLLVSLVVALGGFLMGFDSAVISGVVDPVREQFDLESSEIGWAVACLTLGATLAMAVAGPLADRFGRRTVLLWTALLFTISAAGSALAPTYEVLVWARIIGGLGVGGALLIAPIYIAELAPPEQRGKLVSFNQLNIVLGFSAAFFSNYFLEKALEGTAEAWRYMLGVEAVPAAAYFLLLLIVPRSPRWLAATGRSDEALAVLARAVGEDRAGAALTEVQYSVAAAAEHGRPKASELLAPRMRRVMLIGLGLGFFQQITGINAIFYYSTTIFGMTGASRDVALEQAIWVGLVNVVFTLIAMRLIDRLGRRPLLIVGTSVMTLALLTNAWAFNTAEYRLGEPGSEAAVVLGDSFAPELATALQPMVGVAHDGELAFLAAARQAASDAGLDVAADFTPRAQDLAKSCLHLDGTLVLIAILAYIAAFAISLGPVMWAMFSEIFPLRVRGLAISAAGFFNSFISFGVQQEFPLGLEVLGPGPVFLIFGVFAALAFLFSLFVVPETKGRSLEELEAELIGN